MKKISTLLCITFAINLQTALCKLKETISLLASSDEQQTISKTGTHWTPGPIYPYANEDNKTCWINFGAKKLFQDMENIEEKYKKIRDDFENGTNIGQFDEEMLNVMLSLRGIAARAVHDMGSLQAVPAGIDLDGHTLLRLNDSILFLHRMTLRNKTNFRVTYLGNDLKNMFVEIRILLHELHLSGTYERTMTDKDPMNLFYRPTSGTVEILLDGVALRAEGRYRMLKDRLSVEMIVSTLNLRGVRLELHSENSNFTFDLPVKGVDDFKSRLKSNLGAWLKDWLNDYLIYFASSSPRSNPGLLEYDLKKTSAVNNYVDHVIKKMIQKQEQLQISSVKLPFFHIYGVDGSELRLIDGALHGLDSMYRRSVATERTEDSDRRRIDAIIGFSELKVIYHYQALPDRSSPWRHGHLVLSAKEMKACMKLILIKEPDAVDILFSIPENLKTEPLTVEGAGDRHIEHFRQLLEHQVTALMSASITHHVQKLTSLLQCEPDFRGLPDAENLHLKKSR